jgi:alanine racemase
VELRDAGLTARILVFESVPGEQYEEVLKSGLEATIVSLSSASSLDQVARRMGTVARVHVKVDTGMGRLGIALDGAVETIARITSLRGLDVIGICSHFATSEDADQSYARFQLEQFKSVVAQLAGRGVRFAIRHMANSGAIMAIPDSHFDMVRPGIMLYGYPPGEGMIERYPVRPVMSLVSRVAFVKTVEPGASISYGRRFIAPTRSRIATVPIGYADGYSRLLTNRASALIRGVRFPVVGTICMDHVMIDLGEDRSVGEGDRVVLMGEDGSERITAWDLARTIGSIPYETTCLVTARVPRVYLGR